MKHRLLIITLTFFLVFAGSFTPKQVCYAASFEEILKKVHEILTGDKDKEDKSKDKESSGEGKSTTKVDDSVDTKTPTKKGESISNTDLSSDEMKVTVKYDSFHKSLYQFIGVITALGSFYLGLSILRSMGMSIISIAQLSTAPSYQKARYQLTKNLLTSVVCVALLGSVALLTELILDIVF